MTWRARWQALGDAIRHAIGVRELHVYGGLLIAIIGGWLLSPAITLVAAGVVLLVLGVAL